MAGLRNEIKFYLNSADAVLLERRLSAVLKKDRFTYENGSYSVQSIYFEDPSISSFYEKLDGIENRCKYRIRYYNNDFSFIRLEKKAKRSNLCEKHGTSVDFPTAEQLCACSFEPMNSTDDVLQDFSRRIRYEGFRPMIYIAYYRKAFTYPASGVRITLDSQVSAERFCAPFGTGQFAPIPILEQNETVLEVKFNNFLSPHISDLLADIPKQASSISKYCKSVEALFLR